MSKVLALESISSMTRNELQYHFYCLGYDAEWSSFITEVSGGFSEDRIEKLLRNFCHLNGIPIVIGPTIHLSQIPKPQCYVTRYSELEALALNLNRHSEWDGFFSDELLLIPKNQRTVCRICRCVIILFRPVCRSGGMSQDVNPNRTTGQHQKFHCN